RAGAVSTTAAFGRNLSGISWLLLGVDCSIGGLRPASAADDPGSTGARKNSAFFCAPNAEIAAGCSSLTALRTTSPGNSLQWFVTGPAAAPDGAGGAYP